MKDQRITLRNYRVQTADNVWHFDAKYNPATETINVSRIMGDVTNAAALKNAIAWMLAEVRGLHISA